MGLFDFFKKKKEGETKSIAKESYDKFCTKCGARMKSDDNVCPHCGKNQSEGTVIGEHTASVKTSNGTFDVKITVSTPPASKAETNAFTRNGLKYHTIETNDGYGGHYTTTVPEYNEINAFYTFLQKYPTISKPEYMRECDYPHFMFENIGVKVVGTLHKELSAKGFYDKAGSADILSTYKVGEIREIAADLDVKVKGKKDEIIQQIVEQADKFALETKLGDKVQTISAYGKQWMADHKDEYEFYHSDKEFNSVEEYRAYWQTHDPHTEAKKNCLKEIKSDKESFGRYAYDTLIGLLEDENDMRGITVCYLKELLIDMSGSLNYADWKRCRFDREIIRETNAIYFTPHLLKNFPKYKQYYMPEMIEEAYSISLPINACSIEDFRDIAEMMFDGTMDEQTRKAYEKKLCQKTVDLGLHR